MMGFCLVAVAFSDPALVAADGNTKEGLLWGENFSAKVIQYEKGETVREPAARPGSPSGKNRVFSRISQPTYTIHRAEAARANGVGLVICPGGGYNDVWLDREGHDLGLWLAKRGITSLVLKYRTNTRGEDSGRPYEWDTYLPAVVSDARKAISILRARAAELGLETDRIGISGYSAGGHLAFSAGFDSRYWADGLGAQAKPNFVGLFYPWMWDGFDSVVASNKELPPTFIMNGGPDQMTPAIRAVQLYSLLLERKAAAELHVFGKGQHGFDLGDGRGESAALWKHSFVAWLQDLGMISQVD